MQENIKVLYRVTNVTTFYPAFKLLSDASVISDPVLYYKQTSCFEQDEDEAT